MSEIHYHLTEQSPQKPYIVLMHGLFGSLDNLSMVRKGLNEHFNVLSIDLPDHGSSAFSERFSFVDYANKIVQLLGLLEIESSHILGHSLGGKVAMKIALLYPQVVDSLIIADIAPVAYTPRHQNVFRALNAVDLLAISSRREADIIMSEYLKEPGVSQFLLKSLYQEEDVWRWRFNLKMLQRDYHELSAAIVSDSDYTKPVLFIKGGQSDYIAAEHRETITQLFPNSQAKIIGSAGHWLHAEKPQIFNRLVNEFLR